MKFGIVNRRTEGWNVYQGWPTVARGEDGTLYAASSGDRMAHICPFGKNLMYVSHDDGETWSAPQIINDTKLDDRDPGLVCWGDGNILLSWFNNEEDVYTAPRHIAKWPILGQPVSLAMLEKWKEVPKEQYGSFTKVSRDNGKTWSKAHMCPVTAPHGPIRRADGSIFYVGTERLSGLDIPADAVCAFQSFDEGETWEFVSRLPMPEEHDGKQVMECCEPHCVDLGNNEILAAVRCVVTDDPTDKFWYLNITTYTCRSLDGGKTWEAPVFMENYGAPPHLMMHSSGALIFVCGKRTDTFGQYARVSYDKGRTWTGDLMISPESPVTDHGYPSTVELSNGDLLTVYYQRVPGDDYNSVLYTRWSLDELK